jgi:peptide/nickel transport system substrate-binding protein
LREAGFKVDLQATDWQTVVTRRASQKPPKEGGWNMFFTNWAAADVSNPVATSRSAAAARMAAGSAGRKTPRSSSCATSSPRILARRAEEDRRRDPEGAYEQVIYIPLGQYLAPSAWRKSLSGVLDGPARRCSGISTSRSRRGGRPADRHCTKAQQLRLHSGAMRASNPESRRYA